MIDKIYSTFDKAHFYLGLVSNVGHNSCIVQVENLSMLNPRLVGLDNLKPNTINYLVLIDSENEVLIGNIFQSKVKNSDSVHESMRLKREEQVFPEIYIEILGRVKSNFSKIETTAFSHPGLTNKVYIANEKMIDFFIKSQEVIDTEGQSLSPFSVLSQHESVDIQLNANTLFNRHLMVVGTTGSGKSTSSLSLMDSLLKSDKKFVMIDPTGEYQNTFSNNEVKKVTLGIDAGISPGSLTIEQWCGFLEASSGIQAPSLLKAIRSLRYQYKHDKSEPYKKIWKEISQVQSDLAELTDEDKEFNVDLLAQQLVEESVEEGSDYGKPNGKFQEKAFVLNANQPLIDRINYKKDTSVMKNLFGNKRTESLFKILEEFLKNEERLIIDASHIDTSDAMGGMVVDLISKKLIKSKTQKPFIFFVDEVHRYALTSHENTFENRYYEGMISIAREGRKKGIYLFLTTQSPNDVSKVLLGQMGTLLIHRITQPEELKAISNFVDDYTTSRIKKLGRGESILTSVNLLRDLDLKIIPCDRIHYNDSPVI